MKLFLLAEEHPFGWQGPLLGANTETMRKLVRITSAAEIDASV